MSQQTITQEGAFFSDQRTKINDMFTEQYNGIAPVAVTGSVTLAAGTHSNRTTTLSKASGLAVTLPAATGSGAFYNLVVITTVTSNSITITCAGSDKMLGQAVIMNDTSNGANVWDAAGTATTFTMNGTTQGGYVGHRIRLEDIAAGKWLVTALGKATGTEATPFS